MVLDVHECKRLVFLVCLNAFNVILYYSRQEIIKCRYRLG